MPRDKATQGFAARPRFSRGRSRKPAENAVSGQKMPFMDGHQLVNQDEKDRADRIRTYMIEAEI
jgi:hypothetical protein